MILWMPRLDASGQYAVGYEPLPDQRSQVVLVDCETAERRIIDPDGTQPVWRGPEILTRPQQHEAEIRIWRPDGTLVGRIPTPTPPNWIEASAYAVTAYLAPPPSPRAWVDGVVVEGMAAVISTDSGRVRLVRHSDGALLAFNGELLNPDPHDSLRAFAHEWVGRVWSVRSRQWHLTVNGRAYPELGPVHKPTIDADLVAWVREEEICIAPLADPTRGWRIRAAGLWPDVRRIGPEHARLVWCTAHGELQHQVLALGQTEDLRVGEAPSPPPAETWQPTTEAVDLWRLFTGAGASQYPRRNPDDPGVYWDCQVARLSTRVEHAWFIKTANGRVYEWRATWVEPNGEAWIGLLEDHDDDGRIYRFRDPRLMRRFARAGDTWERVTQIQEWDRAANQWGPWGGPGSDGRFRFRVRVASVERSSYGRLRAVVEVDTYQDLEVFELLSNKGWSAWEEWTRGHAERGGSPVRELPGGIRVARTKRVEWPERYDGPRAWPVPPRSSWPEALALDLEPTRVTIAEPAEWPQRTRLEGGLASLRCVYRVTQGPEPARVRWELRGSDGSERVADNPGHDHDHTFVVGAPGTYRVVLAAYDDRGRELDRTGKVREWIVQ